MLTITLPKNMLSDFAVLPCPVHGTVMTHTLVKTSLTASNKEPEYSYVCSCGNEIKIEMKEDTDET